MFLLMGFWNPPLLSLQGPLFGVSMETCDMKALNVMQMVKHWPPYLLLVYFILR